MNFLVSASPRLFRGTLFVLAVLVSMTVAGMHKMPVPVFDSLQYLSYARSLFVAGTYATTPAGPRSDGEPGREPLYPLVVAGLGHVLPSLGNALERCAPPSGSCLSGFKVLPFLNALFLAATALLAAVSVEKLGGGRLAAMIAWGYVVFNFQMDKDLKYVISDYLSVFLAGLASLLLIIAVQKGNRAGPWFLAGAALSLLALTKTTFLPFAASVTAVLALAGALRLRREGARALVPAVILAGTLAATSGAWIARNVALFGVPGDERGAIALSTREVFDHMTPAEHEAAFLWWLRGPGPGLARSWFPEDAWRRHEWYAPDGFYLQGQVTRHEDRIERLMREGNLTRANAGARAGGVVIGEILADWPAYLATMPALFYRGLWFDEFIALGFPLLVFTLTRAFRTRRRDLLAALAPGLWSLCVYPAVSLNIPRYQYVSVTALAIAAGLAVERLLVLYREREGGRVR